MRDASLWRGMSSQCVMQVIWRLLRYIIESKKYIEKPMQVFCAWVRV